MKCNCERPSADVRFWLTGFIRWLHHIMPAGNVDLSLDLNAIIPQIAQLVAHLSICPYKNATGIAYTGSSPECLTSFIGPPKICALLEQSTPKYVQPLEDSSKFGASFCAECYYAGLQLPMKTALK